jgi:alpha,alpha-trehalase
VDSWTLRYEGFDPAQQGLRETLCTLGNGYFATRGAPADAVADGTHYPATYLAGGYDRLTTKIGDRVVEHEDLVNIPNWLPLAVRLGEGPWLRASEMEQLEHVQELDLRQGILHRRLRLRDRDGRTLSWRERRLVSMACPHRAAMQIELVAENWSGQLTIRSGLDGSVSNAGVARYRTLAGRHLETLETRHVDDEAILLSTRMVQSRREIAMAARTKLVQSDAAKAVERHTEETDDAIAQFLTLDVKAGETTTVEKAVTLFTSRDPAISEPATAALKELAHCGDFDELAHEQRLVWAHMWSAFDIDIDTSADQDTKMKLHLHIFQLLQTTSPHSVDLDVGVPARGWHGEAYRGHIFWDELFIFPFINLRMPMITRSLLLYRYRRLPEARRAAQLAGHKGAMFPWQSGSSGREESQSLHLNPLSGRWLPDTSHRQRHVNAAIIYNIWQYFQVTEDLEFLVSYGAELMLEIARFWSSLAQFDEPRQRYSIRGVMGPDEFHTTEPGTDPAQAVGLANNAYTNVMVAWCISRTLDALDMLPDSHRVRLCDVLKITTAELAHWDHVSRNLFVPFHGDGIISQFEDYETLKELDWRKYRKKYSNLQRLDRILEAEGDDPNRYKVSKQADVLMLFFLFSTEELKEIFDQLGYHFSPEMIGKNIQYYMARTSHGSTLSWVVHAWILSRWDRKGSWQLFKQAFNSDIGDLQVGTTAEGIHLGAMSGSIDLVQRCYPGIDIRANMLSFNPLLPAELECLRTTIHYRWHTLDVTVTHQNLTVSSRRCTASPITIAYRGHVRAISPGQTYEFRLIRPPEKPPITGPGQRDVLAAVTEQALDTLPDQEPIG